MFEAISNVAHSVCADIVKAGRLGIHYIKVIFIKFGCIKQVDAKAQQTFSDYSAEVNANIRSFIQKHTYEWMLSDNHPDWISNIFRFSHSVVYDGWESPGFQNFKKVLQSFNPYILKYLQELIEAKEWVKACEILSNVYHRNSDFDDELLKLLYVDADPKFIRTLLQQVYDFDVRNQKAEEIFEKSIRSKDVALCTEVIDFIPRHTVYAFKEEVKELIPGYSLSD